MSYQRPDKRFQTVHVWLRTIELVGKEMDKDLVELTFRFIISASLVYGALQGVIPGTWGAGCAAWIMTIRLDELKDEFMERRERAQQELGQYDD